MSNYFDNQTKGWEWDVSPKGVYVTTDHGNHTHSLNVTNVVVGDMAEKTGEVMGKAHRASSHDYKEMKQQETIDVKSNEKPMCSKKNNFTDSLKVDKETLAKLDTIYKTHSNDKNTTSVKKSDEGGRERGDEGPGKQGRESSLKAGRKVSAMRADMKVNSHNNINQKQQVHVAKAADALNNTCHSTSSSSQSGISGNAHNGSTEHGNAEGHGSSVGGHGSTEGKGNFSGGHGDSGGHGSSVGGYGGSGGGGCSVGGHGGSGGHNTSGGHGGH